MLPTLRIGPLALQTPGLLLLLGFWLALEVTARRAARRGLDREAIYNGGFYGALGGILLARVGYVLLHWPAYQDNLLGVLALSPQTLQPAFGLAGGALAAGLHLRRKRVPLRPLLDAAAVGLAVYISAHALGNAAGGFALGRETAVPWAIELWGTLRHPVQLYEFAAGLFSLAGLLWAGRRPEPLASGLLFLLFVALYSASRLLLEPFRATSPLFLGTLRAPQVVGLGVTLVAMGLMAHGSSSPTSLE